MSKPLPKSAYLSGNFAPWLMEGEVHDPVVIGEIPRELAGAYYRNGSNPQFAPGPNYHWFTGDGMIHAFHIEDGRCRYRNRWVRTPRFEVEREAGKALFSGLGPSEPDPRIEGVSGNSSNTNVLWHAGKLLSYWEAGPPYEIDPATLETIGLWDYHGAFHRERMGNVVPDTMTAHPKIDPDTDECLGFGYSPMAPNLVYHVVDADGRLTRSDEIEVPYPCMMHDFVASSEHVLFPVLPAVFNFEKMADTGFPVAWEPERGSQLGVMPRGGGSDDVVWFETDPCFSFHYVNAVSHGSEFVVDYWRLDSLGLVPTERIAGGPPTLHRWTFDVAKGTVKDEALDDAPAEFGRIDPRRAGKEYRDVYSLGTLAIPQSEGEPQFFNSLFHYDMKSGSRRDHRLREGDTFGEPIFVPRTPDAKEGDGFVLAIAHRAAENRSDLLILDAQDIAADPLATVQLPHRIPYGFHGNWRPAG
ncbi:MAG: carotenoid oxygenase family protein [Deltaproteobacteria bacterium]|nr:carotenoid oxygenase family protein [Deltaproteobacteria bacterium]MBW2444373.1 carotenoid oxygenase family protein [Deltaproteobacteria bacterium]